MAEPMLSIRDLIVTNTLDDRRIIDHVSLHVDVGETVGLVGESGSGKSLTSKAVLGILPRNMATSGSVTVAGHEVIGMSRGEQEFLRTKLAAMIFQDARSGINPVRKIKEHFVEGAIAAGVRRKEALRDAAGLLESVGIRSPESVLEKFPHQLSGGMLQRIMISGALSIKPGLILADECTTALDVTTQAEVVSVLEKRRAESGASMLFVTHNLELAAALCSRIYVMRNGKVVESGTADEIFQHPKDEYTKALIAATPRLTGSSTVSDPHSGSELSAPQADLKLDHDRDGENS